MKIKTISLMLVLLLVIAGAMPALASEKVKDVPKDHWAYQSVRKLIEQGYISLYEDNKFKGEKEVTRYELAEVVANVLNNIEQGKVVPEEGDVVTLKKLATEFRSELVKVMNKNEELAKEVDKLEDEQEIVKEDIINTNAQMKELQGQVRNILKDLKADTAKIKQLRSQLSSLRSENQSLEHRISKLEQRIQEKEVEQEEANKKNFLITGGLIITALLLAGN